MAPSRGLELAIVEGESFGSSALGIAKVAHLYFSSARSVSFPKSRGLSDNDESFFLSDDRVVVFGFL